MEFIDIKTTKVIFSDDDKLALERAIEIVNELLDHMDEVDAEDAFGDPHDEDSFISFADVEEATTYLQLITEIQGTNKIKEVYKKPLLFLIKCVDKIHSIPYNILVKRKGKISL